MGKAHASRKASTTMCLNSREIVRSASPHIGRPFAAVHSCWAEADKTASPPAEQMTPQQIVNDTRAETQHEARRLFQLLSSPTVRQDKARAVDIRRGKRRGSEQAR
jgi:hypothetical protein